MAHRYPPLATSKTQMLAQLGLYGSHGEEIYKLMLVSIHLNNRRGSSFSRVIQAEAARGRDRVSMDRSNCTEHSQNALIQPPYKWDQLQETARHRETLRIAAEASPHTKPYFQIGHYESAEPENWVAKWFMWHCFRYRDNRHNKETADQGQGQYQGGKMPARQKRGVEKPRRVQTDVV
jgi:hypothetical protein